MELSIDPTKSLYPERLFIGPHARLQLRDNGEYTIAVWDTAHGNTVKTTGSFLEKGRYRRLFDQLGYAGVEHVPSLQKIDVGGYSVTPDLRAYRVSFGPEYPEIRINLVVRTWGRFSFHFKKTGAGGHDIGMPEGG